MSEKKMLEIVFVTDYVCPYCLVGKEALKRGLEELGAEARIVTAPMELTVEPAPRVDTWHDETRRARYRILVEPARQLGLDMKLPPVIVPRPYTRLAFEGHFYAREHGAEEAYDDAVYRAYFIDEKDIGDIRVLGEIAEQAGLDREGYLRALRDGLYAAKQKEANAYARQVLNVTAIPTLYINGQKYRFQEFTKEEAIRMIRKEQETAAGAEIHGCNADGCF